MRSFTVHGTQRIVRQCREIGLCIGIAFILSLTGCGSPQDETELTAESVELNRDSSQQADSDGMLLPEDRQAETEELSETVGEYPVLIQLEDRDYKLVIESEGIYCIVADGYYGYITETGREITPFIYSEGSPFSEGLACVCLEGKYGFIGSQGETVLDFTYDYATPFVEGLAYFAIGDSYGFMDRSGEPVFYLDCDSISSFHEGLAYFSIDGKYGYIDRTGAVALEPVYDDADFFRDGMARVRVGGNTIWIDTSGREALPSVDYDSFLMQGDFCLMQKNGLTSCYIRDESGEWSFLFQSQGRLSLWNKEADRDEARFILSEGYYYGLVAADGTIVLEPIYEDVTPIKDYKFVVLQITDDVFLEGDCHCGAEYEYALYDLEGNAVIPFGEYEWMDYYDDIPGFLRIEKDGQEGWLHLDDMTLEMFPEEYDDVWSFKGGSYACVRQGAYGGVMDRTGALIFPIEYDTVYVFSNGSVALCNDTGEISLYDDEQNLLYQAVLDVPNGYPRIYEKGEGYVVYTNYYTRTYLSSRGEEIGTVVTTSQPRWRDDSQITVQPNIEFYKEESGGYINGYTIVKEEREGDAAIEERGAILKNAITPRIKPYNEIFLKRVGCMEDSPKTLSVSGTRPLFRLYGVDGCEAPMLYYYEDHFQYGTFPQNISRFYQVQGAQAETVALADYDGLDGSRQVVLWWDNVTGQILPGMEDYDVLSYSGGSVYGNAGSGFRETVSFYSHTYYKHYDSDWDFSREELLGTPELFYGRNDEPYTADTILDAEYLTVYEVDGERATFENFQETKNRYEKLDTKW